MSVRTSRWPGRGPERGSLLPEVTRPRRRPDSPPGTQRSPCFCVVRASERAEGAATGGSLFILVQAGAPLPDGHRTPRGLLVKPLLPSEPRGWGGGARGLPWGTHPAEGLGPALVAEQGAGKAASPARWDGEKVKRRPSHHRHPRSLRVAKATLPIPARGCRD